MNDSRNCIDYLEKLNSHDKDFRFMAASDLLNELKKDQAQFGVEMIGKITAMVLKLLADPNGEVQNLAMRCIGPLSKKCPENVVLEVVNELCQNISSANDALRDISVACLKSLFETTPKSAKIASTLCATVSHRILRILKDSSSEVVFLESLDILAEVLHKFGNIRDESKETTLPLIQNQLMAILSHSRLAVRKRAILALGHLAACGTEPLILSIISEILQKLDILDNLVDARVYISCLSVLTRSVPTFIGENMDKVFTLVIKWSQNEDDDLREACINLFEVLILRCPKDIKPFISDIIQLCLSYVKHDPNYNYEDEFGDGEDFSGMDTDENVEEDEDDVFSDGDDISWKVRRASAKCLTSLITSKSDILLDIYPIISPGLISRFKEREETVQLEIFATYLCLLKQAGYVLAISEKVDSSPILKNQLLSVVSQDIPAIWRSFKKLMKQKSQKLRLSCFTILKQLVTVIPGCLAPMMDDIIHCVKFSLDDKNSNANMKIEMLTFLSALCASPSPHVFHSDQVDIIVRLICEATHDSFYKVTSEGLNLSMGLTKVLKGLRDDPMLEFNCEGFIRTLYESTFRIFSRTDIDQEVKERAILCMATLHSFFIEYLSKEFLQCLPVYLSRLKNEVTRLATTKAIIILSKCLRDISFASFLPELIDELALLLRKSCRSLRIASLTALQLLVNRYGGNAPNFTSVQFELISCEVASIINDNDLHIAKLSLSLISALLRSNQKFAKLLLEQTPCSLLEELKKLATSSFLQGAALNSLCEVFCDLLQVHLCSGDAIHLSKISYIQLVSNLIQLVCSKEAQSSSLSLAKQGFHSSAKIIASLTLKNPTEGNVMIQSFFQNISCSPDSSLVLLSLLSLGYIGSKMNLSGSFSDIQSIVMSAFTSPSEDIKASASFAFGRICAGNLPQFLPLLIKEIESAGKFQYLLLHSLKEVISEESISPESIADFQEYICQIWDLLFDHCESTEEGTRNVVAECLGKLTLLNPESLLPELRKRLGSSSAFTRGIVATAIKFTLSSEKPLPVDKHLKQYLGDFLQLIQDKDLSVKRLGLIAFNSASHNKPALIRPLLPRIISSIYAETRVHKQLIRQVQMGPFLHTVDDGLEIRKAAFESLYTMLDSCIDLIEIHEFLNHVQEGLSDHHDVKLISHIILSRLCSINPIPVLQKLTAFLDPLLATLRSHPPQNAVKQEIDKHDDLLLSALGLINRLTAIPENGSNHKSALAEIQSFIEQSPVLSPKWISIRKAETHKMNSDSMDWS